MRKRSNLIKYATVIIVTLLLFNPELAELALFIDAVGLDVFLLLIEAQVVALVGYVLTSVVKPVLNSFKRLGSELLCVGDCRKFRLNQGALAVLASSPALLMNAVVLFYIIGSLFLAIK
jgi:hypothetical protein